MQILGQTMDKKPKKYILFNEKGYTNKKSTRTNLKNIFLKNSFSKKSKELH